MNKQVVRRVNRVVVGLTAAAATLAIATLASAQVVRGTGCGATVAEYRNGALVGNLCESDALAKGLTIVDLGDNWVPFGLRAGDGLEAPDYRETFLALARQDPEVTRDPRSIGLGLYGVFPTLSLIVSRMEEEERYACHAAVPSEPATVFGKRMVEEPVAVGLARVRAHAKQRNALEQQMHKRNFASLQQLGAHSAYFQRAVRTLEAREARTSAIHMVQEHLVCEPSIAESTEVCVDGILSWRTTRALRLYQRQHFTPPSGWIDESTRKLVQAAPAHNDWRNALRVLRERIVDATGLIEDGSATMSEEPIAGQTLDPLDLVWPLGYSASANGQGDRIGVATDRAARELGWKDSESVVRFFRQHAGQVRGAFQLQVALKLSPKPSYYSQHMNLRVEIDLGTQSKAKKAGNGGAKSRRPALLLFVDDGDTTRLLARWPTTIGGWQDERLTSGAVALRYKPSDIGDFVWKNLYVAPRWLPPQSTPHDDVVKRTAKGGWALDREVLGPSYRSAYGLAMLILHKPYKKRDETRYADQGIRVHGTGNILSLPRGSSHGCHRLLGFQVLRLTSFLLRHRNYVRIGPEPVAYQRTFRMKGKAFPVKISTRGYRFDLTPPLPVRIGPQ